MLPAVRFYTYSKRFEEAYTAAMRPLTEELDMAQPAVDILLFLANNPGMDTARDICTYRHLKPAIVSFHVEKLAGEGYLERQPVPGDRRKCRLVCFRCFAVFGENMDRLSGSRKATKGDVK